MRPKMDQRHKGKNPSFGGSADLKKKKSAKQAQATEETTAQVRKTIQKPKAKNVFSHLEKVDLSADLNMKKVLVAKRRERE